MKPFHYFIQPRSSSLSGTPANPSRSSSHSFIQNNHRLTFFPLPTLTSTLRPAVFYYKIARAHNISCMHKGHNFVMTSSPASFQEETPSKNPFSSHIKTINTALSWKNQATCYLYVYFMYSYGKDPSSTQVIIIATTCVPRSYSIIIIIICACVHLCAHRAKNIHQGWISATPYNNLQVIPSTDILYTQMSTPLTD